MSEVLAGQVLRFQWNAYSSSWGPALRDLRTAGLFHDLTLVTADNTAVSAHKLVLAACSAFFRGSYQKSVKPSCYHKSHIFQQSIYSGEIYVLISQFVPQDFSPPSHCPPRAPSVPL